MNQNLTSRDPDRQEDIAGFFTPDAPGEGSTYSQIISGIRRQGLETVGRRGKDSYRSVNHLQLERMLAPEQAEALLNLLEERFKSTPAYYNTPQFRKQREGIDFANVKDSLRENPEAMWSLMQLEITGGEPDVFEERNGEYIFKDASFESPTGRRNMDLDECEIEAREFGVEMESKAGYRRLQELGRFDVIGNHIRSASILKTPPEIRKNGNAIHGFRLYGYETFTESNAETRSKDTGWRAVLRVKKV